MIANVSARLATAAAVIASSAVVAVGTAGPAHAVPGMVFVSAQSATDARAGRTQAAHCPAGLRVLGGGAYVGLGGRQVHVDSMRPVTTKGGDFFEVTASVTTRADGTGYRGAWYVLAYAICGTAPAGLEYVSTSAPSSFATLRTVTATCPIGKRVIGTGGQVSPAFGFVLLDEITPSLHLTSVRVTAAEAETPSPLPWRPTAFAICADPLPELSLLWVTSPADSGDKSVSVSCPKGARVHGLGASQLGVPGQQLLTALHPSQPLTQAHASIHEDLTGFAGLWQARVYAICAR